MSDRDAPGGSPTGADPTDETDRLEQLIRSIPPPEVPHDLSGRVMTAVRRVEAGFSPWQRFRRARRGETVLHRVQSAASDGLREAGGGWIVGSKRWVMYAIAGVAVLAIGTFAIFGFPPVMESTAGTVGAAKRYSGEKMSARDVAVSDADVQRFLQSDTWDRLIKNKSTRTALQNIFANKALTQALASQGLLSELGNPTLGQLLSNASLDAALTRPGLAEALQAPKIAAALADVKVQAALADPAVQAALAQPGIASDLADSTTSAALQKQDLHDSHLLAVSAANAGFAALVGNQAFQEALAQPGFLDALNNAAFMHALAEPAFANALQVGLFRNFICDQLVVSALNSPAFAQALQDSSLQAAFAQGNFEAALSNAAFQSAFSNAGFQTQLQASLSAGFNR